MRMARGFFLVIALTLLAGCGFKPLYATTATSPGGAALNQTALAVIADRDGQKLRNLLTDRMHLRGTPQQPLYRLAITLERSETELGIRKDATASRAQLTLIAKMALTDTAGKMLLTTTAQSSVSYNKLDAQYATLAAEENATDRALRTIADKIVNRLAVHFGATPPAS